MATKTQIAANRLNAKKSTGPITPGGRYRARLNAFTHGLTARQIITFDEDEDAFNAWHKDIINSLKPVGALEANLVQEIAIAGWKLARLHRIESRQFETEKAVIERRVRETNEIKETRPDDYNYLPTRTSLKIREEETDEPDGEYVANSARIFRQLGDDIATLSRYRASIERTYYRALHQLERVQLRRHGGIVDAPLALNVNIDGESRD